MAQAFNFKTGNLAAGKQLKLLLIVTFTGVYFDQLTKYIARNQFYDNPVFISGTEIGFSLAFNSGSAFSLFEGSTLVLTIAGSVVFCFLIFVVLKSTDTRVAFSYSLIAAGALGNLLDRFFQEPYAGRGLVTDFIKVGNFPTFNVADSLISMGVALLIFFSVFATKRTIDESN